MSDSNGDDRVYALQTPISKLWCTSLHHQAVKALQLVRLRQSYQSTSAGITNLASLPEELFQHVLSFLRLAIIEEHKDAYPFTQLCQCVDSKTIWSKQITLEAFDKWAYRERGLPLRTKPGTKEGNEKHLILSRFYSDFEGTKDWLDVSMPIRMEAWYDCGKCKEEWIRTWLYLSGRRHDASEQAKAAKMILDTFLADHGIATLLVDVQEDWYSDGEEDIEDCDAQDYLMTITPSSHTAGDNVMWGNEKLLDEVSYKALKPSLRAFERFATRCGLIPKEDADWLQMEVVDSW